MRWIEVLGKTVAMVDSRDAGLTPTEKRVLIRLLLADGSVTVAEARRDLAGQTEPRRHNWVEHWIHELRRKLDPENRGQSSTLIKNAMEQGRPAYVLVLARCEVDMWVFEDLVVGARCAETADAIGLLRQARQLWKDDPLQDVGEYRLADTTRSRLFELHDEAERRLHELEEALGQNEDGKLQLELVIHIFAEAGSPVAYEQLGRLWVDCRERFDMCRPIGNIGIPEEFPPISTVGSRQGIGREVALAAQENPDVRSQAILRLHDGVLNLSVAVPVEVRADGAVVDGWDEVGGLSLDSLIGVAHVYLAQVGQRVLADEGELKRRLPAPFDAAATTFGRATTSQGFVVVEDGAAADGRAERRLLILGDPLSYPGLHAWAWSYGNVAMPPLARYLLQAAVIRHQLRVWEGSGEVTTLLGSFATGSIAAMDQREHNAELLVEKIRLIRRNVHSGISNMCTCLGADAGLAELGTGPFADDHDLAEWFAGRLDDDLEDLTAAGRTAGSVAENLRRRRRAGEG